MHTHKDTFIFICTSKDCKKRGAELVRNELKDKIKEKGLKKSVKIIKTKCMGACKKGPNVIHGDQMYHKVTPGRLHQFLEKN